jgi:hypothetical protein
MFQIIASSGQKVSINGKELTGSFSITATNAQGTSIATANGTFTFQVDFSGSSSLKTNSASNDVTFLTRSASVESFLKTSEMQLRSSGSLMYCPKSIVNCTDSDWSAQACSGTCKISGTTVTETGATKLGSYVFVGNGVEGESNTPKSSDSSAYTISVVLYLAATALLHLSI